MKFYDRKEELEEFSFLDKKRPAFLVVTGRRRVGKTETILHYSKNRKNFLYLFVDDKKNEQMLVEEYMKNLGSAVVLPDYAGDIKTFESFLSFIFELSKREDIIIAFDEFQRFLKVNPSIINQFQKMWDLNKRGSKIFLIASGSSVGMIKKIFSEEKAPLFKRADNIIYLKIFSFKVIMQILKDIGIKKFEERVKIYFIFGGVIYYYNLIEKYGVSSSRDAIDILVLREIAPLKNEIRDILIEEFGREHITYYEIMNALGMGKNTKREMADHVHVEETSLSPYLSDLEDLVGVVDYIQPATAGPKSKKGRYFLKDAFFKFWFKFIYRNKSFYESGRYDMIRKRVDKEIDSFYGRSFECLAIDFIKEGYGSIPFTPSKAGRWWGHTRVDGVRKEIEIDIAALNEDDKKILFGECKWKEKVDAAKLLKELKEKAKFVDWHSDKRKEYFAIFAKSFKSRKVDGVMLYDLKYIEKRVEEGR